jgi:hypothetical protein
VEEADPSESPDLIPGCTGFGAEEADPWSLSTREKGRKGLSGERRKIIANRYHGILVYYTI